MQKENLFFFADIYCFEPCMQQNECGSKPKIGRIFSYFCRIILFYSEILLLLHVNLKSTMTKNQSYEDVVKITKAGEL